jgi:CheY-like chemotaxis protein
MLSSPAPLRILIVEDSPDDAELMELALRRGAADFTAVRVEARDEFLARLEVDLPDVILCDFHLPRFSCGEVLAMLQELQLPVPVVVVSRHISPEEAESMLAAGASACVMKNRLAALGATVDSVLRGVRPAA